MWKCQSRQGYEHKKKILIPNVSINCIVCVYIESKNVCRCMYIHLYVFIYVRCHTHMHLKSNCQFYDIFMLQTTEKKINCTYMQHSICILMSFLSLRLHMYVQSIVAVVKMHSCNNATHCQLYFTQICNRLTITFHSSIHFSLSGIRNTNS